MADLTNHGLSSLRKAIQQIKAGDAARVDLGHGTIVYKVPSNNPKKFTIRIDIKIEEEDI